MDKIQVWEMIREIENTILNHEVPDNWQEEQSAYDNEGCCNGCDKCMPF